MSALDDYRDVIEVANPELLSYWERQNDNLALSEARIGKAVTALAKELESLQPDATLGALVRQLRPGHRLEHNHNKTDEPWAWSVYDDLRGSLAGGKTPEAALREALKEQDE